MSHYSVMAIRKPDNKVSIEKSMDRYYEELEVEPYVYKSFDKVVEEGRKLVDSSTGEERIKIIVDGGTKEEWKKKFAEEYSSVIGNWGDDVIDSAWETDCDIAKIIKDSTKRSIEDSEYHNVAVKYQGYECDEHGNVLSTYNPNSKWDWYVIGGRWSGELILKKEAAERYGTDRVDKALCKEIDWAKMNSLSNKERDHYVEIWKYHVMEEPFPGTDEEKRERLGFFLYKKEWYLKRYKTLDNFLASMSRWITHAVLDNEGNWHEAGEMGYFGVSSAEIDDEIAWENGFSENFLEKLSPDTEITILDCHI